MKASPDTSPWTEGSFLLPAGAYTRTRAARRRRRRSRGNGARRPRARPRAGLNTEANTNHSFYLVATFLLLLSGFFGVYRPISFDPHVTIKHNEEDLFAPDFHAGFRTWHSPR